jgi:hypothetical protein
MPRRLPAGSKWLALIAPAALFAQGEFATVTGVVTDRSKAVIAGVAIALRNTDTNAVRATVSGADGSFTLTELTPGSYELTASKAGFSTYRELRIVLDIGQQLQNDIELPLGPVNETISVTAHVAALNTQDGAIKGAVVVQQEIQDVPLDGRDFTDIAFLVPGVLPNAQGGAGSAMAITARAATIPTSTSTASAIATPAALPPSSGRISTRWKNSRWKSAVSRRNTARWPAAS